MRPDRSARYLRTRPDGRIPNFGVGLPAAARWKRQIPPDAERCGRIRQMAESGRMTPAVLGSAPTRYPRLRVATETHMCHRAPSESSVPLICSLHKRGNYFFNSTFGGQMFGKDTPGNPRESTGDKSGSERPASSNRAQRRASAGGAGQRPIGGSRQRLGVDPGRGQPRRTGKQRRRRPWWSGPMPIAAAVIVVFAIVAGIIIAANSGGNGMYSDDPLLAKPVAASVLDKVVHISPSVISTVGAGTIVDPLQAISGPALRTGGRPQVLYIGGDFCPVCAADRWSLVNALSRFGTFSGLLYMRSAVTDLDLVTFTFHSSSYASKYINFVSVENEDRNQNLLQSMTGQQQQLLSTLGGNGYPFLDIDGKYTNDAKGAFPGGYNPNLLGGLTWSQVADGLSDAANPLTRAIVANANYKTAGICKVTGNQPSSACGNATIQHIEQLLPKS